MLTQTTTDLLSELSVHADEDAWRAFDARWRPILFRVGRRLGLVEEDADDAAQETLARFAVAYRAGEYDRSRGRLRSWLLGIARHCITDMQRADAGRRERHGISAIINLPDDDRLGQLWDDEFHSALLGLSLRELREQTKTDPRTIHAFEMLTLRQCSAPEVCAALEMTANDVYLAKHRCLTRLREIFYGLRETYEPY